MKKSGFNYLFLHNKPTLSHKSVQHPDYKCYHRLGFPTRSGFLVLSGFLYRYYRVTLYQSIVLDSIMMK